MLLAFSYDRDKPSNRPVSNDLTCTNDMLYLPVISDTDVALRGSNNKSYYKSDIFAVKMCNISELTYLLTKYRYRTS